MEQKLDDAYYLLDGDIASHIDKSMLPHVVGCSHDRFRRLVEEDEKITKIVLGLASEDCDESSVASSAIITRYNHRYISVDDMNNKTVKGLMELSGNDPALTYSAIQLWITRPRRIAIGSRALARMLGKHLEVGFNGWVPWQITPIAEQVMRIRNGFAVHKLFPEEATAAINLARNIRMNESEYYGQFWTEIFGDEEWIEDTICSIMCAKKEQISSLIYKWATVGADILNVRPDCIACFNEGNPNILDMYKVADNKYNVTLSIDMEDLPVCDPVVRESLLNARLQFHVIIPNNDKVVIMDGEPVIKYGDVVSKVHRDTMYSHFGLMINRFRKRMIDLIDVVLI